MTSNWINDSNWIWDKLSENEAGQDEQTEIKMKRPWALLMEDWLLVYLRRMANTGFKAHWNTTC